MLATACKLEPQKVEDKVEVPSSNRDSDSGHGNISSSLPSSELSSTEDLREAEEDGEQDDDYFLDAADHVQGSPEDKDIGACRQPESKQEAHKKAPEVEEEAALEARLGETAVILRMALNNEFARALEICNRRADRELYASLASATLSFLRAALTIEVGDIQAALASITRSSEVSAARRKRTSAASMVMRFLYKPNYNTYTDHQVHAELVHAESLLLLSLISFLADQSIICLVRGALRIRTCYQRYKECLYILETRTEWQSEEARRHFESGVRMGHGIFNLLMSYLPRRVLRLLEYVGFSGNRSIAVEELDKSVALNDGLRSVFSTLVILTYNSYIENIFGLGSYECTKVEKLNELLRADYPNSAFYFLFVGRYYQMQGQLDEAIDSFERCIKSQDDWKQFHSICHWEIMWCYAVQMDWSKAAHFADLLRKQSKWSPASYTYQYATFLYAKLVEDQRANLCDINSDEYRRRMDEIREIMGTVPELRVRYAGKTIPAEKFAITRAAKFCEQENRLTLPALEFLYIWNIFVTLRKSPKQTERLLVRIEDEIEYLIANNNSSGQSTPDEEVSESDIDSTTTVGERIHGHPISSESVLWTDDLSLSYVLKGMCLKHLNRLGEAEKCFMMVIDNQDNIKADTFLVPHASMELSLIKLGEHKFEDSRQWIRVARNNYTGYLLETMVHFRLHAANRAIRLEQFNRNGRNESGLDNFYCNQIDETSLNQTGQSFSSNLNTKISSTCQT